MIRKFLILFISAAVFFVSCGDDGLTPPRSRIKVAAILDLSGHYSQFGEEVRQGMNLFLADYPDSKYEISYLDSKGNALTALDLFNTASLDTNVKMVVTLASWISNAVAPAAKQKNILHFAVGSAVFDYPNNGNTVRFTGDVKDETIYLIEYLKDFQKIGLMYFDNDYGRGWDSSLSNALGSRLLLKKSYKDTDTNFIPILQDMKTAEPEIIVLISTIEAVRITKQANEIGLTAKLLGNRPILTEALLKEPAAEGLVFSYPDLNENFPAYSKYNVKYSRKPSSFAAEGYDLAASIYNFIKTKGFDRQTVYSDYKNLIYSGMFSELKFNENAQANSKYNLMIIKSGNYQDYK